MLDVYKAVAKALFELGKVKSAELSRFTDEDLKAKPAVKH
jgi:hypothetical protein